MVSNEWVIVFPTFYEKKKSGQTILSWGLYVFQW
jgi:hypothetical protein